MRNTLALLLLMVSFGAICQSPSIKIVDIPNFAYCGGSKVKILFSTSGNFNANNNFAAELSLLNANNYISYPSVKSGDTLIVTLPQNVLTPSNYRTINFQIRIASSNPRVLSPERQLVMTDKPKITFSGDLIADPYQSVSLTPSYTGWLPMTVNFSNGKSISITESSTSLQVISPTSTEFIPTSVSNSCGVGVATGKQTLKVQPIDLRIASTNLQGYQCLGSSFYVNIIKSSKFNADNTFTVQCRNSPGTFQNCKTTMINDSLLKVEIPTNTTMSSINELRVIGSSPEIISRGFSTYSNLKNRTANVKLSSSTTTMAAFTYLIVEADVVGTGTFTFSNGEVLRSNSTNSSYYLMRNDQRNKNYTLVGAKDACGEIPIGSENSVTIPDLLVNNKIFIATPPFSVCNDGKSPITIPVYFENDISDNGNFRVEFSYGNGFSSDVTSSLPARLSSDKKNIVVDFPTELVKKFSYSTDISLYFRILSTNPSFVSSQDTYINIAKTPTATICCDGTMNNIGYYLIQSRLTGGAPYNIELTDGTNTFTYNNIFSGNLEVYPHKTTDYTIKSISNACGVGTVNNSYSTVRISKTSPENTLTIKKDFKNDLCAGSSFDLTFVSTGKTSDSYKVELFNRNSNGFTNVITVGEGKGSPIKVTIPSDMALLGTNDTERFIKMIRVVSSDGNLTSNHLPLFVKTIPKASFTGTKVFVGQQINQTILLKGGEPFYFSFNNEPETYAITQNYLQNKIPNETLAQNITKTFQTTGEFGLTSVRNECGVGSVDKSSILTTVPFTIEIDQITQKICKGNLVPITYNIVGSNQKVDMDVQISTDGVNFKSLEVYEQGNPVWVKIPTTYSENNYTIRLKAKNHEIYSLNTSFVLISPPTLTMTAKDGSNVGTIETYQNSYDCIKVTSNTKYGWEAWIEGINSSNFITGTEACFTVSPEKSTIYTILKAINTCGFYDVTGNKSVTINFKPSITINTTNPQVCEGGTFNYSYQTRGTVPENTKYEILLMNWGKNQFTSLGSDFPINFDGKIKVPSPLEEGVYYLSIRSSSGSISVTNQSSVTIISKPSATITDGSTVINPNEIAYIPIVLGTKFGQSTLTFADGYKTQVNSFETFIPTPRLTSTSVFELKSITNVCGTETASGKFTVNVNPESQKKIKASGPITTCAGEKISVGYELTGNINIKNLVAQLSDEKGENFKTITTSPSTYAGYLDAVIPASTKAGNNYRLKVVSTTESDIQSSASNYPLKIVENFTVTITPIRPYFSDKPAEIKLEFNGQGPWFGYYRDTVTNYTSGLTILTSPYILNYQSSRPTAVINFTRFYNNTCQNGIISGKNPVLIDKLTPNEAFQSSTFKIFPNPTDSYLKIESDENFNKILIFDAVGKLIKEISDPKILERKLIDIKDLNAGKYTIEGIIRTHSQRMPFIKL